MVQKDKFFKLLWKLSINFLQNVNKVWSMLKQNKNTTQRPKKKKKEKATKNTTYLFSSYVCF